MNYLKRNITKVAPVALTAMLVVPLVVSAQFGGGGGSGLEGVITDIGILVRRIIPVVVALALLFFFWGVAMYILNAGNEQKRSEGRGIMVWGIIALFVIVSVWGLVFVLAQTFGVQVGGSAPIPTI